MLRNSDVIESNLADKPGEADRRLVSILFARLDTAAMATAMGVTFAIGLFLATAVLLLKGAPPGVPIGGNLSALTTFLPGYEVTWWGAVLGGLYGFVVGAIAGFLLAALWNFTHVLFIGIGALKGDWLE